MPGKYEDNMGAWQSISTPGARKCLSVGFYVTIIGHSMDDKTKQSRHRFLLVVGRYPKVPATLGGQCNAEVTCALGAASRVIQHYGSKD